MRVCGAGPAIPARPGSELPLISFAAGLIWSQDPMAICEVLARIGAPLDSVDRHGSTALHVAASCGMARLLIDALEMARGIDGFPTSLLTTLA